MSPQSSLTDFCEDGLRDPSELTEAEREVYVAVECGGIAVRKLTREPTVARARLGTCSSGRAFAWPTATSGCRRHGEPA